MTIQDVEVYISSNEEERIAFLRDMLNMSSAAINEVLELEEVSDIAEFFWNLQD